MARKFALVIVAGLLSLLATGCIVSMEPQTATNPVGTDHTVTVTFGEADLTEEEYVELLCELAELLFPEEDTSDCSPDPQAAAAQVEQVSEIEHHFEVISGPNAGTHSEEDDIEDEETPDGEILSWTYTSNGAPGRDVIRYCDVGTLLSLEFLYEDYVLASENDPELTEEEFFDAIVEFFNEHLDTEFDSLEAMVCRTVTKTWVAESRPNLGAGLSGLFQGQPTALPTAAAPSAPSPVIRPPSTGDAGLK